MRNLLQLKESNNSITGNSISFIDIDETTFHTFAKIGVYKDGKKIRTLNNQEFNTYTLQDGESFNFDEFQDSKVFNKTSKPIKEMVKKIKKLIDCIKLYDKPEKVIFLTARSDFNNKELFLKTFRENGIDVDIPNVYIERSGNLQHIKSVADRKKTIILKYLKTGEFSAVRMYDDDNKNLETFVELGKEINSGKYGILKLVKERFPRVNKILFFPLKVKEDGKVVKLTESVIMERLYPEMDKSLYDNCLIVTKDKDGKPNAYTKWLCNMILSKKVSVNFLFPDNLRLVTRDLFDAHKKYKKAGLVKDINEYKSFDEFKKDVERVAESGYKSRKEIDNEAKKGAEVIYNKNNIKILNITSREAAIKYGRGTNWCTSSMVNDFWFNSYVVKDRMYIWYVFDLNNQTKYGVSIKNNINHPPSIKIYNSSNNNILEYEDDKDFKIKDEKYLNICKLIVELAKEKINYNNVKEGLNKDLSTKVIKLDESVLMERIFPEIDEITYDKILSATGNSIYDKKANAYTKWLCQLLVDGKIDKSDIIDNSGRVFYIRNLIDLHKKYKKAGLVKDIMSYDSFKEFNNDIDKIFNSQYKSNKDMDEEAKNNVKVIYDKDSIKIIEILSYISAVKYGYGTKWCVASKSNDYHFNEYTNTPERHLLYAFSGDKKYGIYVQAIPMHFYNGVYYKDINFKWNKGKFDITKNDVKGIPTGDLKLQIWNEKDDEIYSSRTWIDENEEFSYHIVGDDLFNDYIVYDSLDENSLDKKTFAIIYKSIIKTYLPDIQKIKNNK